MKGNHCDAREFTCRREIKKQQTFRNESHMMMSLSKTTIWLQNLIKWNVIEGFGISLFQRLKKNILSI